MIGVFIHAQISAGIRDSIVEPWTLSGFKLSMTRMLGNEPKKVLLKGTRTRIQRVSDLGEEMRRQ
jgi:hypothetical protein